MSDIRGKKPKVLGSRVAGLRLTPEERSVMARIDGQKSVEELVQLTGLESARLEQIVSKLAFEGAVDLGAEPKVPAFRDLDLPPEVNDGSSTTSMSDLAAALGMDPSAFQAAPETPSAAPAPSQPARPKLRVRPRPPQEDQLPIEAAPPPPPPPPPPMDDPDDPEALPDSNPYLAEMAAAADAAFGTLDDQEQHELIEVRDEDEEQDSQAPIAEQEPAEALPKDDKEEQVARAVAERNYRQVYEKVWHQQTVDARIGGAKTAKGADLLALCFDPDPRVIAAILENATVGLDHVRLIAFYHRTNTGLEIVARRQDWIRDMLVERRLLRNPMIGEIVLGRVMQPKRLFPTYKIAIDRDIPELTRSKCRGMIRQKWATAPPEERADLLYRTEARCLTIMTGCTFDAKTTAMLCGRPINSVMFVQSVSKFPAAPPGLLAHLYKQAFVRKNPPLKKMLLAHPNMPGDIKRSI